MTIEQMIDSGCTMEDLLDAVQEMWEKKVAAESKEKESAEKRKVLVDAYLDYIKFMIPEITDEEANASIQNLDRSLNELEKAVEHIRGLEDRIHNVFYKAETKGKTDKATDTKSLQEFIDKMGW